MRSGEDGAEAGAGQGVRTDSASKPQVVRLAPYSQLATSYDGALGIPSFVRTKRAFELVVKRYGLRFGTAADVGCGTGLFACYLRRCWGVPVFGVDRSTAMLRVASCRCRDTDVQFLEQDIRCLSLPCPVDLITANFDTVNHLMTTADLGLAFRRISENLTPGGHFMFDVITHHQPAGHPTAYVRRLRAKGRRLFQQVRWDPGRALLSITIIHCGPRRVAPSVEFHVERAYSPVSVGRLLLDAGFVIRGVLDAESLRPPTTCPPRLLVVARKGAAVS